LAEHRGTVQILLACVFTAMLGLGIISPILPIYAQSLGATLTQVGLLSSAWSISRLVFTAPIGRFSDRSSKKRIIAAGLLVYAVVSLLYSFAWDFTSLVTIRLLHGLGSAMSMPIAMAYAAEITPKGREGRFMGMMNFAMFGGMGLGPLIGGYLSDVFTLSAPFYVMAGITAFSLAMTVFLLPDDKGRRTVTADTKGVFRRVLSKRVLRAVFVYRTVAALGRGSIMTFLSIYMGLPIEDGGLGLSLSATGFVLSTGQFASALLQQPFGELADRYNKIALTLAGGVLGAFGMALLPFADGFWTILAAQLTFSAGSALGMPALTAIVAIEGRELGIGTTMSVLQSAMSLGMIAGPLVSGVLGDILGLKPIFFIGSTIILAGTASFYALQKIG
jgi:DHA1 family multidrug resistance protein-like MFS transporter